jgi:hypothetical protein
VAFSNLWLPPADGLCCALNKNRMMDNVKKFNNSRRIHL